MANSSEALKEKLDSFESWAIRILEQEGYPTKLHQVITGISSEYLERLLTSNNLSPEEEEKKEIFTKYQDKFPFHTEKMPDRVYLCYEILRCLPELRQFSSSPEDSYKILRAFNFAWATFEVGASFDTKELKAGRRAQEGGQKGRNTRIQHLKLRDDALKSEAKRIKQEFCRLSKGEIAKILYESFEWDRYEAEKPSIERIRHII